MNKAEQREAAKRIMAKLGPITEEEMRTYEMLMKRPEEYRAPDPSTGSRVCGVCREKFETTKEEGQEVTALQKFTEHQGKHNPSPGQWTEAHRKIEGGKQRKNTESV